MNNPFRLIMIGDFGKDMDDEMTLVLQKGIRRHPMFRSRRLNHQDPFQLISVVANLAPAKERARLAKGTLELIGYSHVPVGVGTDCGLGNRGHEHEFRGIPYMASADAIVDGADLLIESLHQSENGSVALLLASGLTDIANLLRRNPELVKQKTGRVAIMGGIQQRNDQPILDSDGFLIPDSAANNEFDVESARYVYRRLQQLRIPLVILTREAAYAAKVPRNLYDRLAATGHPVGEKLREMQKTSIQELWFRSNLPFNDNRRNKLPERCNKE
ncbi:MAG: hypothetical protein FJ267_08800 [Planctomycetes bacterium]|nr:hypothetical protein [Planctomycetota bacterium]